MTLDLAPGIPLTIDNQRYVVEEHSAFHDVDFRLDIIRLEGPTPAHTRWLVAILPEPYLMLVQRLYHDWLTPPHTSFVHDGESFVNLYRGSAHRVRRVHNARAKEGRMEYALFRANSGRVILTIGHNDELEAWIGTTLPAGAIALPMSKPG
jgi:hypothetical protein